jgi:hypothetical protein
VSEKLSDGHNDGPNERRTHGKSDTNSDHNSDRPRTVRRTVLPCEQGIRIKDDGQKPNLCLQVTVKCNLTASDFDKVNVGAENTCSSFEVARISSFVPSF